MATALFFPAFTGVVPEVVAEPRLQAANGFLRLGMNIARIGGFAVAGGAVAALGAGWAMAPTSGSCSRRPCLSPDSACRRGSAEGRRARTVRRLRACCVTCGSGWQEFRSRQWLVGRRAAVRLRDPMLFQAVWAVLGPVMANERLGGARGWSWVLGAESVGMLVGVVFAIRARPKYPVRLVVLLTFPLASLPLVLGLGAPLPVAVVAAFVGGVALDILVVMWDTTMQREIPKEALSRVSSYDALGTLMLVPVGLLLAGPSVDLFGAANAMLFSAVVTAVASGLALLSPAYAGCAGRRRPMPATATP